MNIILFLSKKSFYENRSLTFYFRLHAIFSLFITNATCNVSGKRIKLFYSRSCKCHWGSRDFDV